MKKFNRGFTLIELLVVIAIIGILSTIVLASLGTARTKGEDSAIQANLSNMRAQAELVYSNANNYGPAFSNGACPTVAGNDLFSTTSTGTLFNLVSGTYTRAGTGNVNCFSTVSPAAWVVAAKLKGTGYACADSSGNSKTYTAGAIVNLSGAAANSAASSTAAVCN